MPLTPLTPDPAQRAADLRRLAHRVQAMLVHALPRLAGDDTWIGAAPQQCRQDLAGHARALSLAAEQLLATARRLEHDHQVATP